MTGIGYIFALEDGNILSADDYGFGAVRWFMNDRELNNPECSVYYERRNGTNIHFGLLLPRAII